MVLFSWRTSCTPSTIKCGWPIDCSRKLKQWDVIEVLRSYFTTQSKFLVKSDSTVVITIVVHLLVIWLFYKTNSHHSGCHGVANAHGRPFQTTLFRLSQKVFKINLKVFSKALLPPLKLVLITLNAFCHNVWICNFWYKICVYNSNPFGELKKNLHYS